MTVKNKNQQFPDHEETKYDYTGVSKSIKSAANHEIIEKLAHAYEIEKDRYPKRTPAELLNRSSKRL